MEKHFHNKDERQANENVVSIVDNDFILNFLNEYDHHPKNNFYANPNLASSFQNFYEAFPLENPNLHFIGNALAKGNENPNENERFQGQNCKMEEHIVHIPIQVKKDNEKKTKKKTTNYKKKTNYKNAKKSEKCNPVNLMQIKEINDNEELFNYRNNIKNTYINKISNLITNNVEENHNLSKKSNKLKSENEDSENEIYDNNLQTKRSQKYPEYKKNDDLERLNKKLEKNRESARNSRKRKKIYIELLENKVADLTHQLETVKKSLDFNQEQLTKISSHSKFLNNLIQIKQQIYTKLDKLSVHQTNHNENEINLLIDSLRLRLGATGKERVTAINSLFKQIIQILLPGYIRFLLGVSTDSACKIDETNEKLFNYKSNNLNETSLNNDIASCLNSEFFSEEQQRRLFAEVGLNDTQKKSFRKFKKKITSENIKLKNFLENIFSLKKNLQKETLNIDNAVDELRNSFTPLQITKFLLFVEKEKKSNSMKMTLKQLLIPADNDDYESDSNSSNFSDINKESEIEIEIPKQDTNNGEPEIEVDENEKKEENSLKSRKKVHLNEELVSPL